MTAPAPTFSRRPHHTAPPCTPQDVVRQRSRDATCRIRGSLPKASNPGRSLAGTVQSIGHEVTEFKPGDEVYGTCAGSFTEYARVETGMLAPKPTTLSFEQAAAVPISGSTALQAVRKAQVQAGQRVLIVGASGGVGTFAVQIAKALGAEVTGVCSTAKTELVRALGAAHVIDYTIDDFADGTHRYDVILDTGGNRPPLSARAPLAPAGPVCRRLYYEWPGWTSPLSYANTTAWRRSRKPSLVSTLETWVLMVPSPR